MRARWPYLTVLLVTALLAAHSFGWPLGRDQGIEGTVGWMMFKGAVPYRDIWTHSPPGGFVSFGLGYLLFGLHSWTVRLVDLLFVAGTAMTLMFILRREEENAAGWIAGLIFPFTYYAWGGPWHTAQRDALMMLPSALAIAFALSKKERGDLWSGAFVGLATLFKPGGVFMTLPALWGALQRREWRWCARMLAGGAAVGTSFALALLVSGAWAGFWEGVGDFNRGYVEHYAAHSTGKAGQALTQSIEYFITTRPELVGALLVLLVRSPLRPVVLLWWLAAAASVQTQASLYPYHLLPFLAPLAMALGLGLSHAWLRIERTAMRAALVLACALCTLPALSHYAGEVSLVTGCRGAGANEQPECRARHQGQTWFEDLCAELDIQEGDRALVWGIAAQLYLTSGLEPGSRYFVNFPVLAPWRPDDLRADMMAQLEQDPPRFIFVLSNDAVPWLSGTAKDSAQALGDFPELVELLSRRYVVRAQQRTVLVLERAP